jgi:molecular chaperone DnaK
MALLGIDLGTTFCAVATLDDRGRAVTVPNCDGEMLTPSAVYLAGGAAVVGQAALDVSQESPGDVATLIKRRMGYPDLGHGVAGRTWQPETLSAVLLKKLAADAESRLGPIGPVVITVPAYFDDTRRKATHDAGRIAGLDVLDILDEPCAAALAYALGSEQPAGERNVLVYDLGGGTFDVSIVRLGRRHIQTVAIEGDVRLGGHDWDARIVDHVAGLVRRETGADPRDDARSLAQLFSAAERAKRTLSKLPRAAITCAHAGRTVTVPLSRHEFEGMTRDLLTRTRLTVQQAMRQAGLAWDAIDRVLLVGGSTHMPMTRQMLTELSGRPPEAGLAVSEVVARGAALHAGIRAAKATPSAASPLDDVVEIQVNAHSIGVEVRHRGERINDPVIPRNTQLPAAASRTYHTVRDGQRQVRVHVLQGDARQADACITVGECWIRDLPPRLPVNSPVEVTCGCRENGLIEVAARDLTSGRSVRAELRRAAGLTDDEVTREREWLNAITID